MSRAFTDSELEAYLDEGLSPSDMAAVEEQARANPSLSHRLAAINHRRDAGVHTLGEIWRRHRISCPTREQLGSYLLDVLPAEVAAYVRFHVEQVSCRFCQANLDDLRRQQQETADTVSVRRTRYFQSSAGYLRGRGGKGAE
jgi:hypothetical protein